jgi:hypothetical protein
VGLTHRWWGHTHTHTHTHMRYPSSFVLHPTTHNHTLYHRQLHSLPLPMSVPLAAPVVLPLHRLPSNLRLTDASQC